MPPGVFFANSADLEIGGKPPGVFFAESADARQVGPAFTGNDRRPQPVGSNAQLGEGDGGDHSEQLRGMLRAGQLDPGVLADHVNARFGPRVRATVACGVRLGGGPRGAGARRPGTGSALVQGTSGGQPLSRRSIPAPPGLEGTLRSHLEGSDSSTSNADDSEVEVEKVLHDMGLENSTTVCLRNLPTHVTQRQLLEKLEEMGFTGTWDFLYIRRRASSDRGRVLALGGGSSPRLDAAWRAGAFGPREGSGDRF